MFPGERLGLHRSGAGSVARLGRRFVALFFDWIVASFLAAGISSLSVGSANASTYSRPEHQSLVYAIWVLLMMIEVPLMGGTLGHRMLGIAVTPVSGGPVGVWRPLLRAGLLALLIPALVWDSDQRGFHDKISGTILVRT